MAHSVSGHSLGFEVLPTDCWTVIYTYCTFDERVEMNHGLGNLCPEQLLFRFDEVQTEARSLVHHCIELWEFQAFEKNLFDWVEDANAMTSLQRSFNEYKSNQYLVFLIARVLHKHNRFKYINYKTSHERYRDIFLTRKIDELTFTHEDLRKRFNPRHDWVLGRCGLALLPGNQIDRTPSTNFMDQALKNCDGEKLGIYQIYNHVPLILFPEDRECSESPGYNEFLRSLKRMVNFEPFLVIQCLQTMAFPILDKMEICRLLTEQGTSLETIDHILQINIPCIAKKHLLGIADEVCHQQMPIQYVQALLNAHFSHQDGSPKWLQKQWDKIISLSCFSLRAEYRELFLDYAEKSLNTLTEKEIASLLKGCFRSIHCLENNSGQAHREHLCHWLATQSTRYKLNDLYRRIQRHLYLTRRNRQREI